MSDKIKKLKESQLTQVLSDGFAMLYHKRPQFPITFLANYLKNYNQMKQQHQSMIKKISTNEQIHNEIVKEQQAKQKAQAAKQKQQNEKQSNRQLFIHSIESAEIHESVMDRFCDWLQRDKKLTGVYIGQLEYQTKKIDLQTQDSQQAHLDIQNPKNVKFKATSTSHKILLGKTLTLQSVLGKLITQKDQPAETGQAGQEGNNQQDKQQSGQLYIPSVIQNKQLTFFKYPRLGSYYAVRSIVKCFLSDKLFDNNMAKIQAYRKSLKQFQEEQEQKQAKFRQLYDQKANSGAEEKELEQMEKQFQQEQNSLVKPKLEDFQCIERQFAFCFDTLGKDCQMSQQIKQSLKQYVQLLKNAWEKKEKQYLTNDIESYLKLLEGMESPQLEQFTKLIEEQDRQLPSNQEVTKYKDNEILEGLELDTLRIQKVKQYMADQRFLPFFENLLAMNAIKYGQIVKHFLYFLGYEKKQIVIKDTNLMNWRKAKKFLEEKQKIIQSITNYNPRGMKKDIHVHSYAKWQRIARNLQKYDLNTVASYNIYQAFILRFLLLCAKVRKVDRQVRLNEMKEKRKIRKQKLAENQAKIIEKESKRQKAKEQAQQKQQQFDQASWELQYDEQNPLAQVGQEVVDQIDKDLQVGQILPEQPQQQQAPPPPAQ